MYNSSHKEKQPDYNQEPVFFCKNCLSLKIRNGVGLEDSDYCDECGSTEIGQASIEDWQEMYKSKYGHYFLESY